MAEHKKFARKSILQLLGMACVAFALFGAVREFGKQGSRNSPEPLIRCGDEDDAASARILPPFLEDREVVAGIEDDELLETEALYYLLHRCLSGKEPSEETVAWDDLRDFDRRESSRGMLMRVQGSVAGARLFRLGESGDCYRLRARDIDFAQVALHLRDAEDPVSRHAMSLLAHTDLPELLNRYNAFLPPSEELKKALLDGVGGLLENPLLYDPAIFAKRAGEETRSAFEANPSGKALAAANRRLLAEAFPGKLAAVRDASSFGLEGFPVWLACVDTDEAGPCLAVLAEMPGNLRRGDGVEFSASFFKLWRYWNQQEERTHACVFVGKTLRPLPQEPPPSSGRAAWYVSGLLAATGCFLFAAVRRDGKERRGLRLGLRARKARKREPE